MKAMTSTPTPRVMMTVREAVQHVIFESKEPLSAAEIRLRYIAFTGREIDPAGIVKAINQLVAQGKVFSRVETTKERITRAGGDLVRGSVARLYSKYNPVPKRTRALEDVVLGDGKATAFKSKSKSKSSIQPSSSSSSKVVDEVASLVKRVAQLEAQLAEARRVISK